MGGSADKRYNLSYIVEQSVQMGKPIIGVSLNYRLVAFGFLGSKEALAAGATNIGFRDQRLATEWIHENIAAFGGSSDKITIWGESSGAESVTAQVLAYNGKARTCPAVFEQRLIFPNRAAWWAFQERHWSVGIRRHDSKAAWGLQRDGPSSNGL